MEGCVFQQVFHQKHTQLVFPFLFEMYLFLQKVLSIPFKGLAKITESLAGGDVHSTVLRRTMHYARSYERGLCQEASRQSRRVKAKKEKRKKAKKAIKLVNQPLKGATVGITAQHISRTSLINPKMHLTEDITSPISYSKIPPDILVDLYTEKLYPAITLCLYDHRRSGKIWRDTDENYLDRPYPRYSSGVKSIVRLFRFLAFILVLQGMKAL
ncbi:hypothetical protein BGW37DRAFT_314583 [Umbelopsis sp. PMI_123]|nr:hypothetical protein BGW37DRAFT_314583 [Umbelopsis sp. PMI_123]